jgi:ABC-type oligopeptide transport system substrate-binding subunit/tRNA A-37 threonylcarbamoyl transferase component Bud32
MTVETGTLLHDRYRLQSEIGRGGMAAVYRAHDELLDRPVAVKIIRKPELTSDDRQHLLHEARLAAKLNHPHIVTIHDAGEIEGLPYIVMELVEGPSLFERRPANLAETVAMAGQLCEALAHAHDLGIVHRDVKPENILLTAQGEVKLTDFGLALSLASRVSSDGAIVGTVFYLAPEQLQGGAVDGRADLYALGVLLYDWTTGELPFAASETLAVITQHLFAPVVAPQARVPSIPAALDRLIVSLLSKSPDDRPASARQVLEVLRSTERMRPVAGHEPDVPLLERIGRGRMAGREEELALARGLWAKSVGGRSQTLLVSGEAGIGKTRLVRELITLAEVSRGRVLQGWSYAQAGKPFGPFKQILRGAFDDLAPTVAAAPEFVAAALLSIAPEYRPHFPNIALPSSVNTAQEQQRHFEGAAVLLSMLSEQTPVLLVLDDAHWADSGTLSLFRHLVQQTRERRVMFVLAFRDVEPADAPALHEMLYDFRREHLGTSLSLGRLDRRRTEEMLMALLGENIAPDLVEEIFRVTEGNPFFVEEVCKSLAESGGLVHRDGQWRSEGKSLAIPANVKVAVAGRLRALPAETQQALEVAAIRGHDFELEVVQRATGWEATSVIDALETAERAQIIEKLPGANGPRYAFTHTLIPAAMVDEMRSSQRRRLHGQVAPVLEGLHPEEFESLAHHYRSAGDLAKAAGYLLKAGERAHALYALRETIENYNAALELQNEMKLSEESARTLLRLGLVYSADFQFDKAQRAYEQAFDVWERLLPSEGTEPAESPVTLRFAVDEPLTLDPGMAGDDVSAFILGQLFEGLVEVDEASGLVPALAARWDVSEDGRRYIFHIREGRKWSDGTPLTAGDFEFAWKRNLALGPASPAPLLLNIIAQARAHAEGKVPAQDVGVRAVDERTLEVRLEQPAAYFPLLLTHAVTYPLPRRVVEGERQPWSAVGTLVGNGAYRLVEWEPGQRLLFDRNPFYRGLVRGNVGRVEAPVIHDYEALKSFDEGSLDGVSLIKADPNTIRRVKATYRREFSITPSLSTFYVAFCTDRPPFDSPVVRKAFAQAIDRLAFVREAGSVYLAARGGFLPPGMPGHSASVGLAHDPVNARRLLAQAGFAAGAGFPEVELVYTGDPRSSASASFLERAWKETLGVVVRPRGVEWSEFIRRRDEEPPDLSISGWSADYPDPDNMLRVLFHSTQGLNSIRWNEAAFDSRIDEAARITDRKKRIELYQQADRILVADEAAVLPLGYAQGRQLVRPYVHLPRTPPHLLRLKHAIVDRAKA